VGRAHRGAAELELGLRPRKVVVLPVDQRSQLALGRHCCSCPDPPDFMGSGAEQVVWRIRAPPGLAGAETALTLVDLPAHVIVCVVD
jgi:hypothetical protein